jgi:ferric-dicitrate binding protein FerR (iron transport regulator)
MGTKHPLDDIWPALDPPEGFGERVLHALETAPPVEAAPLTPPEVPGPRRRDRRDRVLWLAAGLCAGAVAAAGVMLVHPGRDARVDGTRSGHLVVDIRQTLTLGDRGVAVAERGAELAWFTLAGNPRVEQPRGSVFYRLDRGGPFTVATPVGDVRVTGTCFRVSVEPDPEDAPALVATVEVLEGSVVLEGPDRDLGGSGELPLNAGETGRMSLKGAPARIDPQAGNHGRRDVEARVRQLERALYEARQSAQKRLALAEKVYDPTPEDLRAMAQRCEMRYYLPRHLTSLDAPTLAASLDLSPEQRAAVLSLMAEHRTHYVAALQALYTEVTGDRAIALRLSPKSLQEDLFAKLEAQDLQDARRRIVQEWEQGIAPPPRGTGGPAERFMRLHSGAGDAFFRKLVDLVGTDVAKQVREKTTSDVLTFSPAYSCARTTPRSR